MSDPSPPPRPPLPRPRPGRTLFLNPIDPESQEPADSRTCSFLELADSLTSPVSPSDAPFAWRSLAPHTISAAANPPGPIRMRKSVLRSASLNPASPLDTLPRLSISSADQSFLITDPSLPDSPTLDRRPTHKTTVSVSATSVSLSVNSETKRMNRLVALACLEGRESSGRVPRKTQLNFMSMSDDEDEDDSVTPSPRLSSDRDATQRSSTITASDVSVLAILSSGRKEVELLSPDSTVSQQPERSIPAPASNGHRSQTTESWFPPLSNFVDLKNEEDSPNWRSFIEFSTSTT